MRRMHICKEAVNRHRFAAQHTLPADAGEVHNHGLSRPKARFTMLPTLKISAKVQRHMTPIQDNNGKHLNDTASVRFLTEQFQSACGPYNRFNVLIPRCTPMRHSNCEVRW